MANPQINSRVQHGRRGVIGVRSILMLLVAVILLPFLAVAMFNAQRNLRAEQAAAESRALTQARLLAGRVDDMVSGVNALLLVLSESLSTNPKDAAANNARLAAIGAQLPEIYSQLRISDTSGHALAHSTGNVVDIDSRKYFQDAMARPGLAVGVPVKSLRNGTWTIGFARAVQDDSGQVKAVVSITLQLDRLHEILDNRGLTADSTIFVLNNQGTVVLLRAQKPERQIGVNVASLPTGRRALELRDGTDMVTTAGGVERLTAYAQAKRVPWITVVAVPTGTALAGVRQEQKLAVASFAVALLFALVMGWLTARKLINPLMRIAADAEAFGAGDLAHRSTVAGPAEMGLLARTFNQLAEDVESRTELLRQGEARYRAMFEANPQPMWVCERATLRFLAVNDAAVEHYGYSREEFLSMSSLDIRPPEEAERLIELLKQRVPGRHRTGVWRHRKKDGTLIEVEVSNHDVVFNGLSALHSLAVDVTERMNMEREIRHLNQGLEERVQLRTAELESANRELETFTYSVSHDLRSPLRAIEGFSELLYEQHADSLKGEALLYLQRMRAAAQRMGELIDALLNLSQLTLMPLEKTSVNLSAIATQIAGDLTRLAPERSVTWNIEAGLATWGEASLLRSVMENLLGNAWKYSRAVPQAVIEFGSTGPEGGMAEFHVRDNGAGFDMTYANRLFTVFQRLHTQKEFEGTGVGLATVQRIIQRHGGRVSGEGQPGAGACIRFWLPMAGGTE